MSTRSRNTLPFPPALVEVRPPIEESCHLLVKGGLLFRIGRYLRSGILRKHLVKRLLWLIDYWTGSRKSELKEPTVSGLLWRASSATGGLKMLLLFCIIAISINLLSATVTIGSSTTAAFLLIKSKKAHLHEKCHPPPLSAPPASAQKPRTSLYSQTPALHKRLGDDGGDFHKLWISN